MDTIQEMEMSLTKDPLTTPQYDQAVDYALGRLRTELRPELCYHNIDHTIEEVLPATMKLASFYDLSEQERHLLRTAAAFHDLGFIYNPDGHEIVSARIAAQKLPDFGFDARQIEIIMGIIMATRLPQMPHNLLEEIMADADLDVLGCDEFLDYNELLRCERLVLGQPQTPCEWYDEQIVFIEQHSYFTEAARQLREAGKQRNIAQLRQLLQECLEN
jgi:uncharacterized protein